MTLGKCSIYGTSTRQKLNAKSSTESELKAVNDVDATDTIDPIPS